jgi:hypothetical protein
MRVFGKFGQASSGGALWNKVPARVNREDNVNHRAPGGQTSSHAREIVAHLPNVSPLIIEARHGAAAANRGSLVRRPGKGGGEREEEKVVVHVLRRDKDSDSSEFPNFYFWRFPVAWATSNCSFRFQLSPSERMGIDGSLAAPQPPSNNNSFQTNETAPTHQRPLHIIPRSSLCSVS